MSEASDRAIADAPQGNWVDRALPRGLRPYARLARLDRPIGWWLLLLPCWWGLLLAGIANGRGVEVWYAALFWLGAIVMRGAGCTLNDMVDRDIDAQVERTRLRPIAAGRISLPAAFVFLAAQSLIGLAVLLQFNRYTILLGASSLLIVAIYPFMKRITYWPQVILGLAFNWGALLGWTALQSGLSLPPLLLYAGGIFWTLGYDTIYAHQDKEDDVLVGVKSTALKFGRHSLPWLIAFYTAALVLIDASIWLAGGSPIAHIGVAGAALHAAWQLARFDADDGARCLMLFRSNRTFGLILVAGLFLDSLIA